MIPPLMEVPYFIPWINSKDKKFVIKALDSRWLSNGENLIHFQKKLEQTLNSRHVLAVGSATHALHLALRAINISVGDEVIVPTFTFVASANAAKYCGAKIVLADVDIETFNILPSEIEKKITKKTKAIVVVHYGGQSCDMAEIVKISRKNNLYIIEDCAHALGSTYKNKYCGTIGDAGCFSFYPTKVITTGEGGAVTTNSLKIAQRVKILRSQGMDISPKEREKVHKWKYDIVDLGYNYRMDELRAALGLSQLNRLEEINNRRCKIAQVYDKYLGKVKGIKIPVKRTDRNHIYHLYTIRVDGHALTRNELFKKLSKNGVGASVQYYPVHLMTLYKDEYKTHRSRFPNAKLLKDQVLSLPIYPTMTTKQIDKVISLIAG